MLDPKELLDGLRSETEGPTEVDLSEPAESEDGGALITALANGDSIVDFEPSEQSGDSGEFSQNLVDLVDQTELGQLADDIDEWVTVDERARSPWRLRFEDGLKNAGIISDPDDESIAPFKGAAKVTHPLLIEACVQFQARAIAELFPPTGPVKAQVNGTNTDALTEQAERVSDFLNYQILKEDKTYFEDTDQLLMFLPLAGSAFKKTFYDPSWKTVRSVLCKAERVLVPYTATSLYDTPRITHILTVGHQELLKLQQDGYYADISLQEPDETALPNSQILDKVDDREQSLADGDAEHTLYECHCERSFKIDGEEYLPYIITVEKESRKVIGIRRNWREDDESKRKRLWFSHYKYLPGLGFYGHGLIHAIGGLGESATGLVRAVLDSAAFASMQGGFKSRDAKIKGNIRITPGAYLDTDMTFEELSKAFYTPPFKEPSPALVQMLHEIVEAGNRFGSTTEAMVGEANNTGPVGTTLAIIEQGSKVYSAIHMRLHHAAGVEFEQRFELNADHLPDQYPYAVGNSSRRVMREDFSDRVSVTPVSDPRIFSNAQRIALAQGVLQLAQSAPDMYDSFEVHKRMLEALRVPDIDMVLPDPSNVPHADPVSEGSYLLLGKPVKAHIDEAHDAHLAVHGSQYQQFQNLPPELANRIMPALMAHMAEHYSLSYRLQVGQMMGIALPLLETDTKQRQDMPADLDNQIAVAAAQAIQLQEIAVQQQAAAAQQLAAQQQSPGQPQEMSAPVQAPQADPREALAQQQELDQSQLSHEIYLNQIRDAAKFLGKQGAQHIPPKMLVDLSQQLGKSFQETLHQIMMDEMAGQGGSPFPYTESAIQ